jgi:2-haloacid dehalogenase
MRQWLANFITYFAALTVACCNVPFTDTGSTVMKMPSDRPGTKIFDEVRAVLRNTGFRPFALTCKFCSQRRPVSLKHGGIADFFEGRFSVDGVKHHKRARVLLLCRERELRAEPSQFCLKWDTSARL